MKKDFKLKVAAAVMLVAGSTAQAAPVVMADWGVHDATGEFAGQLIFGAGPIAFDHVYTFSLNAPDSYNGLAVAVANDISPVFDITGGTVRLWTDDLDSNYTNDTLVASFAFDSTSVSGTFGPVASGNYYYEVIGTAVGTLGGSYALSSAISPVPEPETYAMLLAGLGLIGFSMRRRKQ